jgi:hypothetical protein
MSSELNFRTLVSFSFCSNLFALTPFAAAQLPVPSLSAISLIRRENAVFCHHPQVSRKSWSTRHSYIISLASLPSLHLLPTNRILFAPRPPNPFTVFRLLLRLSSSLYIKFTLFRCQAKSCHFPEPSCQLLQIHQFRRNIPLPSLCRPEKCRGLFPKAFREFSANSFVSFLIFELDRFSLAAFVDSNSHEICARFVSFGE